MRPFDYFHFQFTAVSRNTFENVMSRGFLLGKSYAVGDSYRGVGERDYHTGVTPEGVLALRLIFSDRASIDMTAREYYGSDLASDESGGHEQIFRGEAALTVRLRNLHGITRKYAASRRDARYADQDATHQDVGALSIGYVSLGQTRSGAVDWRPKAEGGP